MPATIEKLLLLAASVCLLDAYGHTVRPADAQEWENHLRRHNPESLRYLLCANPQELMDQARWAQYLDSYELQSPSIAPQLWRIKLNYKDVQLMLRAHRTPRHRNALTGAQRQALDEAEQWVARLVTPGMPDLGKARVLHDTLVTACTSSPDGAQNAADLFRLRTGTCEAHARALQLLLCLAGVPCELVYGTASPGYTDGTTARHCWNKIQIDGRWLHIDPSWNAALSTPASPSHRFFALPASALHPSHLWDE